MDMGLTGRTALVAAASQGMGKAVALGLAREGVKVAICARGKSALEAAEREIREAGGDVFAETCDVTREDQVAGWIAAVQDRFGGIDICVANAGGPPAKLFEATTVQDWRSAVDLNLMSTVYLARAVLPGMKARGWGRFLAITSISVKEPIGNLVLSNAVRSAVSALLKTLSDEYAPHGVNVNNVCPGYTATDRLQELSSVLAKSAGVSVAEIEKRWTERIPARRLGTPEEFANLVVFLASERAAYITGASIAVDGGLVRSYL
ncbi:MAG: SDR family oxidoreductase [Bryobacteraceae bacterium]|nr:SDR family oxidoreductase [Bryobacteraceae bacterium]